MVRTFQFIPSTAIEPTTHDPARPTGRITKRDCPTFLVSAASTSRDTVRLIAVELTMDEISPERRLDSVIRSPTAYALPPVSDETMNDSSCMSIDICSTIALLLSLIHI